MPSVGIKKIAVIGAGQMGSGIAQVCASSGFEVCLYDVSGAQLEKAQIGIDASIQKLVAKGKLPASASTVAKAIRLCTELSQLSDSDLVIEAIVENEAVKCKLLTQLDQAVKPTAIFASNTSSIPITRLASATKRPAQVIGMHFMNPVPIMQLVEIIPGMATSSETMEAILGLSRALGKETTLSKDFPGFVVNRILMPMLNEAFNTLHEGIASAEDIDKGMKLGTNQPMGPLTLADFIGLDTCLAIMEVLYHGTHDPRYRPAPLLRKYVEAGFLGKKAKRGVYVYE